MTDGILILDKPLGLTSHDAVQQVRRVFGRARSGMQARCDADASGVLVICIGQATRLLEYLTLDEKTYDAVITFGTATDTDDASGEVTEERSAAKLSADDVLRALPHFTGEIEQQVPKYSAVHIQGERAYDLARKGESFELPVRTVTIRELRLTGFVPGEQATAHISVTCSKGTYIRSLARDLGTYLDIPAHLSQLRRTRLGPFSFEAAVDLSTLAAEANPVSRLLPLEEGIRELPQLTLSAVEVKRLATGQSLRVGHVAGDLMGTAAALSEDKRLVAVGIVTAEDGTRWFRPRKVFWKKDSNHAAN